jgi:hypothetical protein
VVVVSPSSRAAKRGSGQVRNTRDADLGGGLEAKSIVQPREQDAVTSVKVVENG